MVIRPKGLLMADITIPGLGVRPSRWRTDWTRFGLLLTKRRWLLLFTMLFALGWSAVEVRSEYLQKRCDSPLGRLAVKARLDLYYSNCRCMKHALDFRDPCNSIYFPLLLG
jgi:hypothetical protein